MGDAARLPALSRKALFAFIALFALTLVFLGVEGDRPALAQERGSGIEAGQVYSWGANGSGQVGNGTSTSQNVITPQLNDLLESVTAIAAGDDFGLAVTADGKVWAWGANYAGQLGQGSTSDEGSNVPVEVTALSGQSVKAVAAGDGHALALTESGAVYGWGDNGYGQAAPGGGESVPTPILIAGIPTMRAIAADGSHSLALTTPDGDIWSWGNNGSGQLGHGALTEDIPPGEVPGMTGTDVIDAGESHSVAIADGQVYTWGSNGRGQLGIGLDDVPQVSAPEEVEELDQASAVSAGENTTLAVQDGDVYGFGANNIGQLGTGDTAEEVFSPVRSDASGDFVQVSAGRGNGMAMEADGTVWGWGSNDQGDIGIGGSVTGFTPNPTQALVPPGANYLATAGEWGMAANLIEAEPPVCEEVSRWGARSDAVVALGAPASAAIEAAADQAPRQVRAAFVVNDDGDESDTSIDSVCDAKDDEGLQCTLRAAIEEANNTPVQDSITFSVASIPVASALPDIVQPLVIDGRRGPALTELLAGAGGIVHGLNFSVGSSELRGMAIGGFANGVGIRVTACAQLVAEGNNIGLSASGGPNRNGTGIRLEGFNSRVGGAADGAANTISGNDIGVEIREAQDNIIQGNYVGTDPTGQIAIGNSVVGVLVQGSANQIGGINAAEGNIVGGNGIGISVVAPAGGSATDNKVEGNFVGHFLGTDLANDIGIFIREGAGKTTITGNTSSSNTEAGIRLEGNGENILRANLVGNDGVNAQPNGQQGVLVRSPKNTIGGSDIPHRNLIAGNTGPGIQLDAGADQNVITGNRIGAIDPTNLLPNGDGIIISSRENVIGGANGTSPGDCTGDCNLIAGNGNNGVIATGATAFQNSITYNWIISNGCDGVLVQGGAQQTLVSNSVVSDNGCNGVHVNGAQTIETLIQSNLIGTRPNGAEDWGNDFSGVFLEASPDTLVGGTPSLRNVISFNRDHGVFIEGPAAANNSIQSNYIGVDISGQAAAANQQSGVYINGASNNTIGGVSTDTRNVISGHSEAGVYITGGTEAIPANNTIRQNYIGLSASGDDAIPNGDGVYIAGSNNTVGPSNVISGNNEAGVLIGFGQGNRIRANFIGTDWSGTEALGNGTAGVEIAFEGIDANHVGGDDAGDGNVISGNNGDGVVIHGPGNFVQGNWIGTDMDENVLNNGGYGVLLVGEEASGNLIGGSFPQAGNIIANNDQSGVMVEAGANTEIRGNSIYNHRLYGIELGNDQVTPNDANDSDDGPNTFQNWPALETASRRGVIGTLDSAPNTDYVLEFFANGACNTSQFGEGELLIVAVTLSTDADGILEFDVDFPSQVPDGAFITATATSQFATDITGNTSEFSNCIPSSGQGGFEVLFSDSLNRPDADICAAGLMDNELGGSGTHGYIPLAGAEVAVDGDWLEGAGDSGVQFADHDDACADPSQEGGSIVQDFNIEVSLDVPAGAAGPYVRARAVTSGANLLDGSSAGFRVELGASGELRVRGLANGAVVAFTGQPQFFDAEAGHRLEVEVAGSGMRVALDGKLMTFDQGGVLRTLLSLPNGSGQNDGAAGLVFSGDGVKAADDIVVTTPRSLEGLPIQTNLPAPFFEGWGPTAWGGMNVSGVDNVIDLLDQVVNPPLWTTIANFAGPSGWLTTFKSAPLPSFNTLANIRNGDEYWLFTTDSTELEFPQEEPSETPTPTPTSEPSATPTSPPTETPPPTETAQPTGTPEPTVSATPTSPPTPSATPTSGPTPGAAIVRDGGFEEGGPGKSPAWEEYSLNFETPLCTVEACGAGDKTFVPHSGEVWAWFGGLGNAAEEGYVRQQVTIPEASEATLRFWLRVPTGGNSLADFLSVQIEGFEVIAFDAFDDLNYPEWTLIEVDITAFAGGGEKELGFYSETTGNGITNFFLDDVEIVVAP